MKQFSRPAAVGVAAAGAALAAATAYKAVQPRSQAPAPRDAPEFGFPVTVSIVAQKRGEPLQPLTTTSPVLAVTNANRDADRDYAARFALYVLYSQRAFEGGELTVEMPPDSKALMGDSHARASHFCSIAAALNAMAAREAMTSVWVGSPHVEPARTVLTRLGPKSYTAPPKGGVATTREFTQMYSEMLAGMLIASNGDDFHQAVERRALAQPGRPRDIVRDEVTKAFHKQSMEHAVLLDRFGKLMNN